MLNNFYKNYCDEFYHILKSIDQDSLEGFYIMLDEAYRHGNKVFILGNGGSCASATHWVCDMGKGINTETSQRMRIISLADNTGIVTALGNDISYDDIFEYQLQNLAEPGDFVICLSVSGNSKNLIKGLSYAQKAGCKTASILGDYNGAAANYSDLTLTVPSQNYGMVEDLHMVINHILSQYIRLQNETVGNGVS